MSGDDAAPFWTNAGFAAPPLQPPQLPPTASLLHRAEAARRAAAARRAVTDGEPHAMRCEVWVRSLLPPLPSAEPSHREEQEEGELVGEGEEGSVMEDADEETEESVPGKAAHTRRLAQVRVGVPLSFVLLACAWCSGSYASAYLR